MPPEHRKVLEPTDEEAMKHKHDTHVCFEAKDQPFVAYFTISGSYSPATYNDPAEYPEVELCCVERDDVDYPGPVPEGEWKALGFDSDYLDGLSEEAIANAPGEDDDPPDPRED